MVSQRLCGCERRCLQSQDASLYALSALHTNGRPRTRVTRTPALNRHHLKDTTNS